MCIAVPIICLCYIRCHTNIDDNVYKKAMAKLALFLMIGSLINILGQAVPGVISHFTQSQAVYITYTLIVLSLLPTPIVILIYLKPVRDALKAAIKSKTGSHNQVHVHQVAAKMNTCRLRSPISSIEYTSIL